MNNINKYDDFVNEGLFRKTFEESLKQLDDNILKYVSLSGEMSQNFSLINDFLNLEYKIYGKLNNLLLKYGNIMTQEQLNEIVKRFKEVCRYRSGYVLKKYDILRNIRDVMNSILHILHHLKKRGMTVNISDDRFDNPLVFYKENNFVFIVHKSYMDRKRKEELEKHKGIDPYGEEEWNN